jgi:hypothetical protein
MSTPPATTSPSLPRQAEGEADVVHQLLARARAAEGKVAGLQRAVLSNRRIGIAIGVLMCRHQLTADQAVAFLKRISQDHNIKMLELAEKVICSEAGAVLEPGPRARRSVTKTADAAPTDPQDEFPRQIV